MAKVNNTPESAV